MKEVFWVSQTAGTIALAFIRLALCAPLTVTPAFAQSSTAESTQARLKDWVVGCQVEPSSDKLLCQMSQHLTERSSGRQVLSLVIRQTTDKNGLSLLMALPHGLDLQSGVSFNVDGANEGEAQYQTSDLNGVYVALPLSEEAIDAMKRGNIFNVQMTSVQGKELVVGASLAGFTSAVDRLERLSE